MEHTVTARRRHAAGEDPAKREAILEGASQVFMEKGFDAAGVNDICRAAGVSKSTLYIYFANKEDLFETLVERERDAMFAGVEALLEGDDPFEAKLRAFVRRTAETVCSDKVILAQRTVIGIAERIPELGARFYDGGPFRAQQVLRRLLEREASAGRLRLPDASLAAYQLIELATAGLWRRRLFGRASTAPTAAELDAAVDSAVALFLAGYGSEESMGTSAPR